MLLLETSVFWDQNADTTFIYKQSSNQGIDCSSPQKVPKKNIGNSMMYLYSENRKFRAKRKKDKRKRKRLLLQGPNKNIGNSISDLSLNSENNSMKKYRENTTLQDEIIRESFKKESVTNVTPA